MRSASPLRSTRVVRPLVAGGEAVSPAGATADGDAGAAEEGVDEGSLAGAGGGVDDMQDARSSATASRHAKVAGAASVTVLVTCLLPCTTTSASR
jgi:hypothetical protein